MFGEALPLAAEASELDAQIAALPDRPAVFLLWPEAGRPFLIRTTVLRRRLNRLLGERARPSRLLNLRGVARRLEYRLVGSTLEASLVYYEFARRHFPDEYRKLTKLRLPPYLKLITGDAFPRTQVTTHFGGQRGVYYGPFRTRANADLFESQFLDFYQLRRCTEALAPSAEHPGCVYGEMNMCLRPCQEVVGVEEYASEAARVTEFLASNGQSLAATIESARDRLSEEMYFEEAAREHKRLEKLNQVLRLRDELARDTRGLNGVAVTQSAEPEAVDLRFVMGGCWQDPLVFPVTESVGKPVSMDQRLRQELTGRLWHDCPQREREEHLALLARWFYASWRDGEWLEFDAPDKLPYRKLVNAIHRVARIGGAACPE
jgi:excinuclease UvrABC nuclease subunit